MFKRIVAAASLAALVFPGSTGCIGSMALSGKVREFNLSVSENPWAREGLFILLYVVLVYPITGSIDLLIVNSIEFWSGTNPISGERATVTVAGTGATHREVAEDGTVAVSTLQADGSIDIEVTSPDGGKSFVRVRKEGDRLVARDAAGPALDEMRRDSY